jgi:spore coat polysaccharide biosynthesis protein SpsF (cytidylyltransferase family)
MVVPIPRTVAVIQARMGSTRLPGKVLVQVGDRPLIAWTIAGVTAIREVAEVVVATTSDPADDELASVVESLGIRLHRGSVHDVLARCWAAVEGFGPEIVLRQTADNPFPDPSVAAAQLDLIAASGADYVGIAGWPIGIAAEVCRASALAAAQAESTDPAEREHVMPFIYRRPQRFDVRQLERSHAGPDGSAGWRYSVDTPADLAVIRILADRLGHGPPVHLADVEALLAADPDLADMNAGVTQRSWRTVEGSTIAPTETEEAIRWTS